MGFRTRPKHLSQGRTLRTTGQESGTGTTKSGTTSTLGGRNPWNKGSTTSTLDATGDGEG